VKIAYKVKHFFEHTLSIFPYGPTHLWNWLLRTGAAWVLFGVGGGLAHAGEGGEEVRVCVDINMTDLIFCINLKH
jgi:hypothetical protein